MATPRVLYIYSNDGSELLKSLDADPTESIPIESDGFTTHYGSYTYSGNKNFIGLATTTNATTPTYAVGDAFTLGTSYMSYTFYIVEQEIPKYTLRIDGVEVTDYENVIINGVSYKCKQASVPTDLTGYTVTVPSGWTTSAGLIEAIGINIKIGSIDYMNFSIGYEGFFSSDEFNFYRSSSSNFICVDVGYPPFENYTPTESFTFQVVSGDVTNLTLIQWLVDNNATFEKESA